MPGVRAARRSDFTPDASKFKEKACRGIRFWITDRSAFDPVRLGVELAVALRKLHPKSWKMKSYNRLLTNRQVFDMVAKGRSAQEIMTAIERQLRGFGKRRAAFLLYR